LKSRHESIGMVINIAQVNGFNVAAVNSMLSQERFRAGIKQDLLIGSQQTPDLPVVRHLLTKHLGADLADRFNGLINFPVIRRIRQQQ